MVLLLLLTSIYLHMGFSQYLVILSLALLYLWLPGYLLIHCNLCSISVRLRVDCADSGSPVWRFPYLLRSGGSLWLSTHAPHLSLGLIPLLFQLSINRARGMPDQSSCSVCRSWDNSPDDPPLPPPPASSHPLYPLILSRNASWNCVFHYCLSLSTSDPWSYLLSLIKGFLCYTFSLVS